MLSKEGRSKISAVLTFVLLFSMLMPAMAFGATVVQLKDIADSYAQKEIQSLVDGGIISGYEDGSFQPTKAMSRAELAKIIVLSQGLKENAEKASAFTDVDKNSWYRGFVGALVESGITQGTSTTSFSPDAKVTREELVVFFVRALGLEEGAGKLAVDAKLSDLKEVSSWAQAHVSLAYKIGFVNGIENKDGTLKFSPKESAERQALARLAYEFKTNKSKFVDKAKEIVKVDALLEVSSVSAVNNTIVEIAFNKEIPSLNASDFTFDNGLSVTGATYKSDSKSVVLLTTSVQTIDQVYKLSYKGKDTGKTIKGVAFIVTSGGGAGGSSRSETRTTDLQKINSGGVFDNLTITSGGPTPIGPASGTTKINGTLTLDPGKDGEISLQNVEAANIVVASGSENSIKFQKTKVKTLKVAANGQTSQVRILSLLGTEITNTDVQSQVILESGAGSLGNINIGSGASGKGIELRGTITGNVYVNAAGATITIAAPKELNAAATSIASLELGANATVTANENTTLGSVSITGPGTSVTFGGTGEINSVTVTEAAIGSTLNLSAGSDISSLVLQTNVTLTGDPEAIVKIKDHIIEDGGTAGISKDSIKKFVMDAIAAIQSFSEYSVSKEDEIKAVGQKIKSARDLGLVDMDISNLNVFDSLYSLIYSLKSSVVAELNSAKAVLAIGYVSGDSASGAKSNLTLPETAGNGTSVAWVSSNVDVVSNNGVVTRPAEGKGNVTVTLTATITKNGLTVTQVFTVVITAPGNTAGTPTLVSLTSEPNSVSLSTYGATKQLVITANYSDNTQAIVNSNEVGYSGNNPFVAKVSSSGEVLAVANGSTVVTATYGGQFVNVPITVNAPVGSVTSVTYVTYNTSSVTSSVYAGQTNNGPGNPLHIPAENAGNFLIIQFSHSLADVTDMVLRTSPIDLDLAFTIRDDTYLIIKYSSTLPVGAHTIDINGIKSDNSPFSVAVYVYQD
ncbi:hypothetical protein GC093_18265 [Paenibacillus sp. LMG 31456]|uniref:SLH domain-containing protein n=1 Tax=Paenibacillus foliorum TaxID=2654974 RepID=A0A972K010_9BACL|nr:S-layer homology domain-containing protein [Paenibacillus foliorum]NOU95154.1 hypothetical protein [Paenibacillus foliorum]